MSKELLFKALNHQPVERVPWVPFSGVHSGLLKGYNAEEVLKEVRGPITKLLKV